MSLLQLSAGITNVREAMCFFCGKPAGTIGLHDAATFQIDERVRACALFLEDTELLAKLSPGDMVALEAKYHTKCLAGLYNRARNAKAKSLKDTDQEEVLSDIVFAELVMYIEETRLDEDIAPVLHLTKLVSLTAAMMQFTLHVQLTLYVETCLGKPNPWLASKKDVKSLLCCLL